MNARMAYAAVARSVTGSGTAAAGSHEGYSRLLRWPADCPYALAIGRTARCHRAM